MPTNISATSTLVLNWTDAGIWQSRLAADYMRMLDLSEGQPLLDLFSEEENFMHTQTVSGRKFFIKGKVFAFLDELRAQGKDGQVLILAAGLAPLSLEIASRFPSSLVFDVDRSNMREKQKLVGDRAANIRFCECDITDVAMLDEVLMREGFRQSRPTIAVLEGIIYYLTSDELGKLLGYLSQMNSQVVGDFGLKPELVNETTREFPKNVFGKIQDQAKLDFITFYSDAEIKELFLRAGFSSTHLANFQAIQKERTGGEFPFTSPDSSWIKAVFAE
ncbi:MAG: class I SAM-dependent methyltransferase [Verrucomicrobiota bacterium]